ncbi:hypothetical protein GCM10023328_11550 [Modestobacter marinus]|uniref:Uncharacterized protein n=1 Tax=Modestobacter marinus TaxID=477641 RepID=A0A846M3Z3_9ACTN|nr:hypothetical protein [Modestobacter marinus]NIH69210.1 hypothetical protein [Modestobacter marinus]GGL76648.1 hypothetical protein GCM10011589_35900 [Modestobacter marinus]
MTEHRTSDNSDLDRTALERALIARQRGARIEPLTPDLQDLVDDLAPWLDALRQIARSAAVSDESSSAFPESEELARADDAAPFAFTPVSDDDPVALMLGLVADPSIALDARKLASTRRRNGMTLNEFVASLRHRGWPIDAPETMRWHKADTVLPRALIAAIAGVLHVQDTDLLARPASVRPAEDPFDDERVAALLREWANEIGLAPNQLRTQLTGLLAGANFRNRTDASVDTLLAILTALRGVSSLLDGQ